MNQNSERDSYGNTKKNEIQKNSSKVSIINQLKSEIREVNKNINNIPQCLNDATNDIIKKNLKIHKDYNIPTIINNEPSSLVKNLQFLDEDNIKLREAISELNIELKEKEIALNESQKILKKINDEYGQMLKQFKKLEEEKNLYKEENEKNKKMLESMNKNFNDYDKIIKQNEQLKTELMKNKEIMINLKGNYTNVTNDFNKIEKDNKYKEIIIKDLKIEGSKIVNMLQNRELLIETYSKKISELNNIIKHKDDELKVMVNFSKEINNENKNNVKELTKQAVKTLKVFYNYMNNTDNQGQVNFVEIKNNKEKDNKNNVGDIIFGNNKNDKNNICNFLLNEAVEYLLYIPEFGVNYINKEFLINNNFKTCLLKSELYSSMIREFELNSFFYNIISKIKKFIIEFNSNSDLEKQNEKKLIDYVKNVSNIRIYFDRINKNNIKYKKENISLKNKLNELNLYIIKLKKEFSNKIQIMKEKMKQLDNCYNKNGKNKNQKKNSENLEILKTPKTDNKNKEGISKLYQEIDKIKNMNYNINQKILEKDEIINNLKNENEKLKSKLNTLRTNPNAENNLKFYNSFSINNINNKDKKKSSRNNNINISEISNNNDIKYITNKNTNSNNEYFFDYSFNDNLSYNSMKYSIKANSNVFNFNKKKKNIRNAIRNMNDLHNNFNENDISNVFYKSNNSTANTNNTNNISFINLKIDNQKQLKYVPNINYKNKEQFKKSINSIITMDNNNKRSNFKGEFEKELILRNIFLIINNFKSKVKEDLFIDMTNKNFKIFKLIQSLNNKIQEIKSNLSSIKDKFKNSHKDKKIKPSQLIEIMEQVEILLLYVKNHLNKVNNDMQDINPFLKLIFDLVSKLVYDLPLQSYKNNNDITSITQNSIGNNIFKKSSSNIKEKNKNNNNKITNGENGDIDNNAIIINNSMRTKESLYPNIQELKQFFDINKKIFSSSELIKYNTIYDGLSIFKLIQVFKDICDNLKKTIYNSKNDYDSDVSDLEENNAFVDTTKNSQIITENSSYHYVNQKIFGLKKFEFNYKIFMEILKNYLVAFEIIVNQIEIEINNNNKEKQYELGEKLNILYNIFEDAVYFKMDRLDDDIIFNRKILLKLLLNHKEYLSIIYDI